ncbi:MAG: DUF1064 domain-containing protein [Lachnospiraceae bacterium]|nr:DUF1064 domain-containing protein [Lachnospiraceae bacterium]
MWKKNKYHAKKIVVDGQKFDSMAEFHRWQELKLLEDSGGICNLQRQVEYILIPEQREPGDGKKKGKLIERKCSYVADFVYSIRDEDGLFYKTVVEDVKGCRKGAAYDLFVVKRKLMLERYGIKIREVNKNG